MTTLHGDSARTVAHDPYLGLPGWLPRIALARDVTDDLLVVAATSAGDTCDPGERQALLAQMIDDGHFEFPIGTSNAYVLRKEARAALLRELSTREEQPSRVRGAMLRVGLGLSLPSLAPQLALWAAEDRDWAHLSKLWTRTSPAALVDHAELREAYAASPEAARQLYPALSHARAFFASFDPLSDRLDLNEMTVGLVREGRTLHTRWARLSDTEAAIIAGTTWMFAQQTLTNAGDERLASYRDTCGAIRDRINRASAAGEVIGPWALSYFYSSAAGISLAHSDWNSTRQEAELAMTMSDTCQLPGMIGAALLGSVAAASGNPQYAEPALRFVARHRAHGCRVAGWFDTHFLLVAADQAGRALDRAGAEAELARYEAQRITFPWFDFLPVYPLVRARINLIWHDPEQSLAEFDAALSPGYGMDLDTPWGPLVVRSRALLLLAAGAVNRARPMIEELRSRTDASVHAVPEALFHLYTGDAAKALAAADAGIHATSLSLSDRAQLYAVKAAALVLDDDGDPDARTRAAIAACTVSEQASTLIPVAMLPTLLRDALFHELRQTEGEGCFLSAAAQRGAFADVRPRFPHESLVRLTPREEVLLPMLATEASPQEIAEQLFVSVNTVRKQVVSLRGKFAASSRAELIHRAKEAGLL